MDGRGRTSLGSLAAVICLLAVVASATLASTARAVDRVYWTNSHAGISFVPFDGSAGGNLSITHVPPSGPLGMAIDLGASMLYRADSGNSKISVANLDGSGDVNLNTAGATGDFPEGVRSTSTRAAIYGRTPSATASRMRGSTGPRREPDDHGPHGHDERPARRRGRSGRQEVYWANAIATRFRFQPGRLRTRRRPEHGQRHVGDLLGVAVDPGGGRIYFASHASGTSGRSGSRI